MLHPTLAHAREAQQPKANRKSGKKAKTTKTPAAAKQSKSKAERAADPLRRSSHFRAFTR